MRRATLATIRRAVLPGAHRWRYAGALCALMLPSAALPAQTASALRPTQPPAPHATAQPSAQPVFATPPLAIVPLDPSFLGAALAVAGTMQAWKGRAYLTGSGSITAGDTTAEVALPARGTLSVCASSTVKLAADTSAPAGEVPGLLVALDRGAVEMSLAPSPAREKNADTLLTPYFRILIGGASPADVKVRLGEHGDTCVDNSGVNAPYVLVTSVFGGGLYRVVPGQRAMFLHGSLQSVVDQENEPCGCPPPPPAARGNAFPLAESEGLAPKKHVPVLAAQAAKGANLTTALSYNGVHRSMQAAGPAVAAAAAPAVSVSPALKPPPKPEKSKKTGFFGRIGRFFARIFGAEQ